MRIRKRKVPLPLSLLSPIPLSDPHLFSQSPVHLHHPHQHQPQPTDYFSLTSAPSDLRPLIVVGDNTNPTSSGVKQEEDKDEQRSCLEFQGGGGEKIAQKTNNDNDDGASKEEVEFALELAVNKNGPVGVSLSSEGLGRWSGGEGVIPLKKRRPSESCLFEKDVHAHDDCEEQTVVATHGCISNSEHDNNNKKGSGGGGGGGSAKQKRGTTIMEGSRCSRVNGRGWRCCQPTLVGYSLCEHHLGKGRLRSMTSVRGRPSSKKQQHHMVKVIKDNYRDQEKKQQASKRANYKLGVVKARSLSSLLGQTASTTTSTTTTNSNNNVGHDISSISNHESDAYGVALSTNQYVK